MNLESEGFSYPPTVASSCFPNKQTNKQTVYEKAMDVLWGAHVVAGDYAE